MNVTNYASDRTMVCYGAEDAEFETEVHNIEKPGPFFHPLLGTLITGGARLLLGVAEILAKRGQIGWAMCDTDSLSFARPDEMEEDDFLARVERVRHWFDSLNPYQLKNDLFEREDVNFSVETREVDKRPEPLFCYAISAKRYALFNVDQQGRPLIRKASAHGLGHLLSPYGQKLASPIPAPSVGLAQIGVERWEHDLWYRIIEEAQRSSDQVSLEMLPGFDQPAVVRYSATTPSLLNWFKKFNAARPRAEQVKPFNFLLMFHTSAAAWRSQLTDHISEEESFSELPRAVAAYDKDIIRAAQRCFDRDTGKLVPPSMLKTYGQALAQYHLHPESKFENAEWIDRGETRRRHVRAELVEYIGKEANRWEEQMFLGADPEAQIRYSFAPTNADVALNMVKTAAKTYGVEKLASAAKVSRQSVHALLADRPSSTKTLQNLILAVPVVERRHQEQLEHEAVIAVVRSRCEVQGTRAFARRAHVDHANLLAVLGERRAVSAKMLAKLELAL